MSEPVQHDLNRTAVYTLLEQRFMALALQAPGVASDRGWSDMSAADAIEQFWTDDWSVSRTSGGPYTTWLGQREGTAVFIQLTSDGSWDVLVADTSQVTAEALLADLTGRLPAAAAGDDGSVPVRFWALGPMGPRSYHRQVVAPVWTDVEDNYPTEVRGALGELMTMGPPVAGGGRLILLHGPAGTGKGLPLGASVLTPSGWRQVRDLNVGDALIARSGRSTRVRRIFDRGEQPIYSVRFTDGAETVCDGDHLWSIQTRKMRRTTGNWTIRSTYDLAQDGLVHDPRGNRRLQPRWFVPLVDPVQHDKVDLPLEPYLLGVLLANGSLTDSCVSFTTNDEQIARTVIERNPDLDIKENTYRTSTARRWRIGKFHDTLRTLGLDRILSGSKFVPAMYLVAHEDARRALLAGLVDCDGSGRGTHRPEYFTTSPQLAEDVTALVQSLGGVTSVSLDRRTPVVYQVAMTLPESPFWLDRKRTADRYVTKPHRGIMAVDPAGRAVTRCLQVDDEEELFVTDDYVVTHNTSAIRAMAQALRSWCSLDYVIDADAFFEHAAYMVDTMVMDEAYVVEPTVDGQPEVPQWRIVVLEDSGEYLRRDATDKVGLGLGRLLNLADGLVGQGLRILILMTTNEPVEELHPAVTRPGRCMANLRMGAFPPDEANGWLAARGIDAKAEGDTALAELYALATGAASDRQQQAVTAALAKAVHVPDRSGVLRWSATPTKENH